MKTLKWLTALAVAVFGLAILAPQATAADAVTGQIVRLVAPATWTDVVDPVTGEITQVLATPPVYAPVQATVIAYGPVGRKTEVVASVGTAADGTFSIVGLTSNVYLKVVPTSADWQPGWLWVEYMSTDPLFASFIQRIAPTVFDVTPSMSLGMIQLQTALANGKVVNALTGAPIAGATVNYNPVGGRGKSFTAVTDASGNYSFSGMDYEEYFVSASAKRYIGGYLGNDNLLYKTQGEASTWGLGTLPGEVIRMMPR